MGRPSTQKYRKMRYLEIFKTIDHRPTTRELALRLGVSHNQVSRDIRELGLQEELNNIEIKTALHYRESFYKENYFSLPLHQRPTTREMAEELGISHNQVARDVNELSEKYGIEIAHSIYSRDNPDILMGFEERKDKYLSYFEEIGYVPFYSYVAKYMGLPKKVVMADYEKLGVTPITQSQYAKRKFIEGVESRKDYYIEHYFQTFTPKTIQEIAYELGIYESVVEKETRYLRETYGYFRYLSKKGQNIRLEIYKKYLAEHPECFSMKQVSEDLGFNLSLVSVDFKELDLTLGSEAYSNFLLLRLPLYKKYNIESDNPLNSTEIIKEMGISPTLFYKDKFFLEKLGLKFKHSTHRKDFIKKEDKIKLYSDYIEKNGFTSFSDLARGVDVHVSVVFNDFKNYNLREYFNIDK